MDEQIYNQDILFEECDKSQDISETEEIPSTYKGVLCGFGCYSGKACGFGCY